MRKIMTISTVLAFALTFGVAYAGDMPMSNDMSSWDNGVTIFAAGSVSTGIIYRAGTGDFGLNEIMSNDEVAFAPLDENGVTLYSVATYPTGPNFLRGSIVSPGEEGSAAGGYEEGRGLEPGNGVTIFDEHSVWAN